MNLKEKWLGICEREKLYNYVISSKTILRLSRKAGRLIGDLHLSLCFSNSNPLVSSLALRKCIPFESAPNP